MTKLIIADDHPLTLLGTETYLKNLGYQVAATYSNGIACLNGILTLQPEVAILDISMPGMSGLEILSLVRLRRLPVKIILQTMHKEVSVFYRAKENEVDGYILKEDAQNDLKLCLEKVKEGGKFLSPNLEGYFIIDKNPENAQMLEALTVKERKILELVKEYKSNREIAEFLFITEKTVEAHKRNISEKLKLPKGKNILLKWTLENL